MGAVYTQLSLEERRKIEKWWHAKVPVREMAPCPEAPQIDYLSRDQNAIFWADDAFPKKYAGYFGHAAQLQTGQAKICATQADPTSRPLQDGCAADKTRLDA